MLTGQNARPAEVTAPGQPVLIVVTGSPCTGKTALAQRLGDSFALPVMTKDTIKETLFDNLGWSDRTWSKRLGGASAEVLYTFAEAHLKAGQSCIVEANFSAAFANPIFQRFEAGYSFLPIQILCLADPAVLRVRFEQRARSGERHPGHQDHLPTDLQTNDPIVGRIEPLDIGGHLIELDTTVFEQMDYDGLCCHILNLWRES
ncbi:MAG: ATP-binding protein [Anaerolineae bacterium]|nr:ATP-binding protein [Anaerolineae bacterium]